MVERLFIYHDIKKGHTKDTIRDKTQKCEVFFPIISFTDKIKATESKRCCAVLSKIYRHRDEGETHKNSREHLITNKTNKEKFKRSAVRNGDVNNHISEHRPLTNHNIVWDFTRCLTFSMN